MLPTSLLCVPTRNLPHIYQSWHLRLSSDIRVAAGRLSILTPKRGVDLCIFFGPTEILVNESSVRVPFVSFLLGHIANNPTLQVVFLHHRTKNITAQCMLLTTCIRMTVQVNHGQSIPIRHWQKGREIRMNSIPLSIRHFQSYWNNDFRLQYSFPTTGSKQPTARVQTEGKKTLPQWLLTSRVGMCIGARRMKNHKSRLNFLFSDAKRKRGTATATTFRLQFEFKLNSPTARTLLSLSTPCSHSPHALFQKCSFKTNKTLSWILSGKRGHGRKEDCIRREGDFVQRGNFSILFGEVNILRGYPDIVSVHVAILHRASLS